MSEAIARGGALTVAAVAIPGSAVVVGGALFARLYAAAHTGVPYLDSAGFRSRQVAAVLGTFGPAAALDLRYVRAMQAIAHNEFNPHKPIGGQLGDEALPGGPSVGPEQVYRATAIHLGLWKPPAGEDERMAYAREARHPLKMLRWGARVFRAKLAAAKGDFAAAIRAYNGKGAKADAYEAKALAFASGDWGEHVFSGPGGAA